MNTRFTFYELKRLATDKASLFFSVALPVFLYLVFGASMDIGDDPMKDGNLNAYVMISMALYAGAIGAVGGAGTAVVDYQSGWSRQLALTPLTHREYLSSQVVGIFVRAAFPVLAVYITGFIAGAQMPTAAWILSCVLCILCSIPFGFYGMAAALLLRGYSAVSIAATSLVVLFFAANAFTPLTETLLNIAQYTPAYGPVALSRFPLSDGAQVISSEPWILDHSVWAAVGNTAAWSIIFIGISVLLLRRDKQK